jgi:hypothetical protein
LRHNCYFVGSGGFLLPPFSLAPAVSPAGSPDIIERILDKQPTTALAQPGPRGSDSLLTNLHVPLRLPRRGGKGIVSFDGSDDARASRTDYRRTSQS